MSLTDLMQTVATCDRYQVPYTAYLKMDDHPKVEPPFENELRRRGHDFGQHAFAGAKPTLEEMRAQLRAEMEAFRTRYGHESVTYRGHSVIWVGWTEMAKYLRENEVRLDTNFAAARYHHGGYVNGSGLPVKFMDEDGRLIDLYEQTTMSTDDGWTTDKIFATPMSMEECTALSKEQADAAIDQYHTVYHPYFHPLRTRSGPTSSQRWLEGVLAYCREREFHFVNGVDWVDFNDGRRSLQVTAYDFQPEDLTVRFVLEAGMNAEALSLILPYAFRGAPMQSAVSMESPYRFWRAILKGDRRCCYPPTIWPASSTSGRSSGDRDQLGSQTEGSPVSNEKPNRSGEGQGLLADSALGGGTCSRRYRRG